MDHIEKLRAAVGASKRDCDATTAAIPGELDKLKAVGENAVPPKPVKPEASLTKHAKAIEVMAWIAHHRGGQPKRARPYAKATAYHRERLVAEINLRHKFHDLARDSADFEAGQIGKRLSELKALKPKGVTFDAYLKDEGEEFGRS